ncbi:coiled-coil domain-containing protein 9B isoform X2 [Esox lucius]|uniref:Coiled-coil domain containing 9B n=1 Tax=Esox lucius TaxID=8010 RepID=A0AAY5JX04_ESOLU|nr:coiled-coil domain-containing protein 9B isoform X2 [Esox lucius]
MPLELHHTTVRAILSRWRKFGTVVNLPRSGCSANSSSRARCKIFQTTPWNSRTSWDLQACLTSAKNPTDVMLKKEQKDVELDKKIEALRRKNEALMKRYQEVEEDKKRAEEEGMALQSSKGKAGDLTITFNKSTRESRVVMTKPSVSATPTPKGVQGPGEKSVEGNLLSLGRGRRKQLLVTMAGNTKGKRVVSERLDRRPGSLDVKSPKEDDQYRVDSAGRGKHPQPAKRDTGAQDEVRQGKGVTEDTFWLSECEPSYLEPGGPGLEGDTDLTIPTSKEEQQEYLRWKMEREEIDRERVARHKNAKGQWRRAWDMDKTHNMFPEKSPGDRERGPTVRGGRQARRGHPKLNADSRDLHPRGKDKEGKDVPVVSSKAKGKDRLTGRARRWDANNDGVDLQAKTSFEEFLEELDALGDTDIDDTTIETSKVKDGDLKMDSSSTLDIVKPKEVESGHVNPGWDQAKRVLATADIPEEGTSKPRKAEGSSPRTTDKKVRFSELIKGPGTSEKPSTGAQNTACSETKGACVLKVASPSKNSYTAMELEEYLPDHQVDDSNVLAAAHSSPDGQRGRTEGPFVLDASKSECAKGGHNRVLVEVKDPAPLPLEHAQSSSNRNAEKLIDSNLSLLSLESRDTQPTHSTSTDKLIIGLHEGISPGSGLGSSAVH